MFKKTRTWGHAGVCFHRCQVELKPINTCDHWESFDLEIRAGQYPNNLYGYRDMWLHTVRDFGYHYITTVLLVVTFAFTRLIITSHMTDDSLLYHCVRVCESTNGHPYNMMQYQYWIFDLTYCDMWFWYLIFDPVWCFFCGIFLTRQLFRI